MNLSVSTNLSVSIAAALAMSVSSGAIADIAQFEIVSQATGNGPWTGSLVTLEVTMDLDQDYDIFQNGDGVTSTVFSILQTTATIDFDGNLNTMDDVVTLSETGKSILYIEAGPDFEVYQLLTPGFDGGVWDTSTDSNFGLSGYNSINFAFANNPTSEPIGDPLHYLEFILGVSPGHIGSLNLNTQYTRLDTVSTSLTIVPAPASLSVLMLSGLVARRRRRA